MGRTLLESWLSTSSPATQNTAAGEKTVDGDTKPWRTRLSENIQGLTSLKDEAVQKKLEEQIGVLTKVVAVIANISRLTGKVAGGKVGEGALCIAGLTTLGTVCVGGGAAVYLTCEGIIKGGSWAKEAMGEQLTTRREQFTTWNNERIERHRQNKMAGWVNSLAYTANRYGSARTEDILRNINAEDLIGPIKARIHSN